MVLGGWEFPRQFSRWGKLKGPYMASTTPPESLSRAKRRHADALRMNTNCEFLIVLRLDKVYYKLIQLCGRRFELRVLKT